MIESKNHQSRNNLRRKKNQKKQLSQNFASENGARMERFFSSIASCYNLIYFNNMLLF